MGSPQVGQLVPPPPPPQGSARRSIPSATSRKPTRIPTNAHATHGRPEAHVPRQMRWGSGGVHRGFARDCRQTFGISARVGPRELGLRRELIPGPSPPISLRVPIPLRRERSNSLGSVRTTSPEKVAGSRASSSARPIWAPLRTCGLSRASRPADLVLFMRGGASSRVAPLPPVRRCLARLHSRLHCRAFAPLSP